MIDGMVLPKEFRDRYPKFSTRLVYDGIMPSGYAATDIRGTKGEVQAAGQVPPIKRISPSFRSFAEREHGEFLIG